MGSECLSLAAILLLNAPIAAVQVDTTLQPIFHTPGASNPGYSGDPNGLMYRNDTGLYHFFWQCADTIQGIGSIQWCHLVSKDYVKWKRLPKILSPGSFSGGATQLPRTKGVKFLFKDMGKGHRFYTAAPTNLSDPFLQQWTESTVPTAIVGSTDPSSGFQQADGGFGAVVGALGNSSKRGAFSLWLANSSFSNFTSAGHNLYEFEWDRTGHDAFQSPVPRDPNFFRLPVPKSNWKVAASNPPTHLWAFEGAMKMCYWAGHDFYVLGSYNGSSSLQTFSPIADPDYRSFGDDPYDFGGSMFASQVFLGANSTAIMSAWVLEGDCNMCVHVYV